MTSIVVVKMNVCSKTHRIEVSMRDDGDMDVRIESDCKNVQEYAKRLTRMTVGDATDFCNSAVVAPDVRAPLSTTCLCPMGILGAAWKELGMVSKSICRRAHSNEVIMDIFDEDLSCDKRSHSTSSQTVSSPNGGI